MENKKTDKGFTSICEQWDRFSKTWPNETPSKTVKKTIEEKLITRNYQIQNKNNFVITDVLCGNVTHKNIPENILNSTTNIILIDGSLAMLNENFAFLQAYYSVKNLPMPEIYIHKIDVRNSIFPVNTKSVDFLYCGCGAKYLGSNYQFINGMAKSIKKRGFIWVHDFIDRTITNYKGETKFDYKLLIETLQNNKIGYYKLENFQKQKNLLAIYGIKTI